MASSSRAKISTRRRFAPVSHPRPNSVEGWISDDEGRQEFLTFWKERSIITPKFIIDQFINRGFNFPNLLEIQGVLPFIQMQGTYYPDLVRVFYSRFKFKDHVATSRVKGVTIILDDDIWVNVTHFNVRDDAINIFGELEDFDRIIAYRSFLCNPSMEIVRLLLAGPLKKEERLLLHLLVWNLCPRATNHAQCSSIDLRIIHAIMNNEPIDWGSLVTMTMLKAKRHPTFKIPYALLISHILKYKGVNVEGEQAVRTTNSNRMLDSTLTKLQMVRVNNIYVHKDNAPNMAENAEDSDEEMVAAVEFPTENIHTAGTSSAPPSMEDMFFDMNKRMQEFFTISEERHEEIIRRISDVDDRVCNLEDKFDAQFNSDASEEF
ncbi:unnamed protein product [Sphenostylis stenocarpa]|uniref:Putative plant transposon protein domain-containing protein n=1 Tax=Sphenostylis stenocarpa TaxID=92480 RepID=A0AA86SUN4_9FABA|nr:unnamed protein product [Sphenostylis stenocarpa]